MGDLLSIPTKQTFLTEDDFRPFKKYVLEYSRIFVLIKPLFVALH